MRKTRPFIALATACFAIAAAAQVKSDSVIRYRQSVMDLMGWNFGPLAAMVKGRVSFDAKEFTLRAERLESLGPQILEGFTKGSDKGAETDAKQEIWDAYDEFQTMVSDYEAASKRLAEAARSGDEARMKEQFRKTAATCKACHEKFRAD